MTWHEGTTSNAEQPHYRDMLAQAVQIATSLSVSDVVVNGGGTGYAVGDFLSFSHASGIHAATFEVTNVDGGGVIQAGGLRIVNGGSFARRVASALLGAGGGGANYNIGDILEIDGGVGGTDFRQRCKLQVATLTGSAVATVTVFEGGGSYINDPTTNEATTTLIGPDGGTGSGAVFDLTMGTAPPASPTTASVLTTTTGSGTGATANLTLTDNGWFVERDDHNFVFNSVNDEKEVVLRGTVAGGDEPLIAFRTWTDVSGVDNFRGVIMLAMDTYNDGLTLENQVGANPNSDTPAQGGGSYVPSLDEQENFWLDITPRKIGGVHRTIGSTTTAYHQWYNGLFNPFGTATEAPYPMAMAGSVSGTRVWTETSTDAIDVTGICEAFRNSDRQGPLFYRRVADGSWIGVHNANDNSFSGGLSTTVDRTVFPIGAPRLAPNVNDLDNIVADGPLPFYSTIARNNGLTATARLMPAPGSNEHTLLPAAVELRASTVAPIEFGPAGVFDNVFWCSGTLTTGATIGAEDRIIDPNDRNVVYRVFPTGVRTEPYSFIAMREGP